MIKFFFTMKSFIFLCFIFLNFTFLNFTYAEEMPLGIFVSGEDSATATPSQGMSISSGGKFILRLHTACFPTNLRAVSNPISPSSMIKAQFDMSVSGQNINFFINFPGNITAKTGMKSASITPIQQSGTITYTQSGGYTIQTCNPTTTFFGTTTTTSFFGGGGWLGGIGSIGGTNSCTAAGYTYNFLTKTYTKNVALPDIVVTEAFVNHNLPAGSIAGIYGNTVQMYINSTTGLSRNPDGSATTSPSPATLKSYSFSQKVLDCSKATKVYGTVGHSSYTPTYACGAFMAKDGPVSASVSNFRLAKDNSSADITVSFPGQTGFCGGYWSPLMIFMDEKRPLFNNISDFPLNPAGKTSWVEAKSKGYFLVYDEKVSGKIEFKDQLFGDSKEFKNGFEKLAKFDTNKDHFISKKDKLFSKLFLWNDKNGNGISDKNELLPLGKVVSRISLKYNPSNIKPIGRFAEERESSKFYYIKNNKEVSGDIVDVWLSPQTSPNLADTAR